MVNNLIQNIIPNETIINIIDEITHHFGCRWISLEIKRIAVDQLDPTGKRPILSNACRVANSKILLRTTYFTAGYQLGTKIEHAKALQNQLKKEHFNKKKYFLFNNF